MVSQSTTAGGLCIWLNRSTLNQIKRLAHRRTGNIGVRILNMLEFRGSWTDVKKFASMCRISGRWIILIKGMDYVHRTLMLDTFAHKYLLAIRLLFALGL